MSLRFSSVLTAFILIYTSGLLAQHAAPDKIEHWAFGGTVGTVRIQANLVVKGDKDLVAGYYFSADHLEHIPLTIKSDDGNFVMTQPDGAVFRLHQQPMDAKHAGPLDFYNNNGLAGTWTDGRRAVPVKLWMSHGAPSENAQEYEQQYSDVTDESPAEFEAKVRQFRNAALAKNKTGVANSVAYPLRVNTGRRARYIHSRQQLIANWSWIITPRLIAKLKLTIPHEMFTHQSMACLGDGLVWFDGRGAEVINLP